MSGFADIALSNTVAKGVLRGDRGALADAYRELSRAVMNMSTRILQDRHLAEEVVQDTFIDLVEKASQIQNSESIVAWVRKVAVNHCLMRLRSPWHARRLDVDAHDIYEKSQAENSMEWVALVPAMEQALGQLSEDARSVIWLHDVEGYTHKEIGTLMGKTSSFSKSQLARAYEKLLAWQAQRDAQEAAVGPNGSQPEPGKEGRHANKTVENIGSSCNG